MELTNFLRIVATIQATFVITATIIIILRYIPIIKVAKDRTERLLAWHVVSLGISFVSANIFICIEFLARYGDFMTWRLPLSLFVFSVGDAGLCLMIWRLVITRKFYQLTENK
jgi:hypothetical protein